MCMKYSKLLKKVKNFLQWLFYVGICTIFDKKEIDTCELIEKKFMFTFDEQLFKNVNWILAVL